MATNMHIRPDVLNAVQTLGGVWDNSAKIEDIESALQGKNTKFVVTPGSIPNQESHKSECYFVYFLNNQGLMKQTTFCMDSKVGKWFHGNASNVSVSDLKLIFEHIQEHAEWKGYKLVSTDQF